MIGAAALSLAAPEFSLAWSHSVEHVEWREDWRIEDDQLRLVSARVKGSGAGMEPGPDAVLKDGWWRWPSSLRVPELALGASGATGEGWRFCADGACRELGAAAGPAVVIKPCGAGE